MLGERPGIFWRICWTYISPVFLLCICVFSFLGYKDMLGEEYKYPEWSTSVGWALTLSSIICIPLYIIYKFCISTGGVVERLRQTFKPEPYIDTTIPGQMTGTSVWHNSASINSRCKTFSPTTTLTTTSNDSASAAAAAFIASKTRLYGSSQDWDIKDFEQLRKILLSENSQLNLSIFATEWLVWRYVY